MFTPGYKRYVLVALTFVYTLNFMDRGLIILLLQPIKEDLHLSDSQLGFLTGIAFGLFYATLGLPIARRADRGNRVTITSIAIGLWGLTVMLCVLIRNFTQLVLARVAAAVGESGCMPPTYSLVGDYFPGPAERTRAISVYWLANPLASLVSFTLGGWLSTLYGWRMTFFLMGIPALIVAVIVKLTIVEPRSSRQAEPAVPAPMPRMLDVLRTLWCQRSSRHLTIAVILVFTLALGLSPWYAAFLMRSHAMTTAEVGFWLGLGFGVFGIAGTLLGGYVTAHWFGNDERGQMRITALMIGLLMPFFALFLLLPQKYQAISALMPLVVVFNFFLGPTFALMQRLVPEQMRATTVSVIMLLANLIGMGIGPQMVGIVSDQLAARVGSDSLRIAMLSLSFIALWAAYHYLQASRTVKQDLAAIEMDQHRMRAAGEWSLANV